MSASISTVTISRLRWSWATSTTCTSGSLNRASALAHQGESEPHVQCSRSRSSVVGLLGRSDLEGPQQLHLRTATPQPPHPHVRSAVMLDWTRALEPRLGQGPPRTSLHRTTRRSSPSGSPVANVLIATRRLLGSGLDLAPLEHSTHRNTRPGR